MRQVDNKFQGTENKNNRNDFSLPIMDPVNGALGDGGDPVDQDRGVPLHQEQREAGDCVAANLTLIPASLSCHCLGNFLHLLHCDPVPSPKRFESKRDE